MSEAEKLKESTRILRGWWCHGLAEKFDASDKAHILAVCDAADAHRATLPKTKEIEVWHCQWVSRSGGGDHLHLNVYPTEGGARDHAEFLEAGGNKSSSALHCVQVTGPHKMMVLA